MLSIYCQGIWPGKRHMARKKAYAICRICPGKMHMARKEAYGRWPGERSIWHPAHPITTSLGRASVELFAAVVQSRPGPGHWMRAAGGGAPGAAPPPRAVRLFSALHYRLSSDNVHNGLLRLSSSKSQLPGGGNRILTRLQIDKLAPSIH
jgi:hypothetical protein